MTAKRTGLVTGATGYVGGLVVKKLLDDGWRVKILARDEDKALRKTWGDEVEIVEGDASERADVATALEGADCAWYLLHSMDDGAGFAQEEADMARQFGEEAKRAGVERIVYLGGLHPSDEEVSEHLASRVRVGVATRAEMPCSRRRSAMRSIVPFAGATNATLPWFCPMCSFSVA